MKYIYNSGKKRKRKEKERKERIRKNSYKLGIIYIYIVVHTAVHLTLLYIIVVFLQSVVIIFNKLEALEEYKLNE